MRSTITANQPLAARWKQEHAGNVGPSSHVSSTPILNLDKKWEFKTLAQGPSFQHTRSLGLNCQTSPHTMRHSWSLILMVVGLTLLVGGFVFDLIFAGIPCKDPTPEMSARYAHHAHIASLLFQFGAGAFLFGSLTAFIHRVVRRFHRPVVS
jgi:hypothetical protein